MSHQIHQDERIKVAIRIRPPIGREEEHENAITVLDDKTVVISRSKSRNEMQFDRVFNSLTTQELIFQEIKENIISVLEGYNSTVFAYGQTGTGKTYTMLGNLGPYFVPQDSSELNEESFDSNEDTAIVTALSTRNEHGIIPRSIRFMFDYVQEHSETIRFRIYCSYLEIYNEKIYDLLNYNKNSALAIREDKHGVYVQSLTTVLVRKEQDVLKLLRTGAANRSISQTEMNDRSSRSHTIFQLIIEQERIEENEQIRCVSKLNLVDLAGSEKWNTWSNTLSDNRRIQEMLNINQSLSNLGNCISALNDSNRKHVPYRDSKLTRLLQDSLGGNCRTFFISTISPSILNYEETMSTLKFSDRANRVTVRASRNELLDDATLMKRYEKEIERLQKQLNISKWRIKELEGENEKLKNEIEKNLKSTPKKSTYSNSTSNDLRSPELLEKLNKVEKISQEQKDRERELDSYHEWLHSIPVKSTNGEFSVDLKDRLNLLEKSVKMQQSELKRAKKLFLRDSENMQSDIFKKDQEISSLKQKISEYENSRKDLSINKRKTPDKFQLNKNTTNFDLELLNQLENYENIKNSSFSSIKASIDHFKDNLSQILHEFFLETLNHKFSTNSSIFQEEINQLVEGCCEALSESFEYNLDNFSHNNHVIMQGMYDMISSLLSKNRETTLEKNQIPPIKHDTTSYELPPSILSIIKETIQEQTTNNTLIKTKWTSLSEQMDLVNKYERKFYSNAGIIQSSLLKISTLLEKIESIDPNINYYQNSLKIQIDLLVDLMKKFEKYVINTEKEQIETINTQNIETYLSKSNRIEIESTMIENVQNAYSIHSLQSTEHLTQFTPSLPSLETSFIPTPIRKSLTPKLFSKDDLERKLADITRSMNDLQSKINIDVNKNY